MTDDAQQQDETSPENLDRFAEILEESRGIKGVSLWQDAWRRLRKNWAAMISLYFLMFVTVLALLTPVLPLQSPLDKDLKYSLFRPPNFEPVSLGERDGLKFAKRDLDENEQQARKAKNKRRNKGKKEDEIEPEIKIGSLVAQLKKYERETAEKRSELEDKRASVRAALQGELEFTQKLREATSDKVSELQDLLETTTTSRRKSAEEQLKAERALEAHLNNHPFEQLWSKPGAITSSLIRLRLAIFGDWCVPSICGTDALGRDILSRVFWGARVSIIVGVVATLVSLIIGVSYGATAGYLGGLTDDIMMRIVDILYSIPFIFVVIFVITILKAEETKAYMDQLGIDQIMIFYVIIGAIYWLTMARVVRGQVISLKNEQFVEAARTIGASQTRIIFRHLIPNVMGIVVVYLTLTIPSVMLFEAFLSFLGLGVEAPDVSWGLLVNEGVKVITPIKTYWWLVLFPGLTLTLTLLGLNFLGDGLRDALDPRLKNR